MGGGHGSSGENPFRTDSGIDVERVYTRVPDAKKYDEDLGDPGQFPYTRGIREGQYRERTWTMRQYAGFGTASETNARFRYLLDSGQTGLSVAFDLPTQMGLDSDHPLAEGEVGRVGVAIDTLGDMRSLFAGIPLDRVSTSMTINSTAATLLALYIAVAEEQGAPASGLRGTVQNDILKEYVARGTQIYPPGPSLRLVVDVIEYCRREAGKWNPISVSGYHMREAGADAVQELAFTLANAIAYVGEVLGRGLDADDFAPRVSFFFSVHNDFLEEIAKFRAARRMWARLMRDRFGAKNPDSMKLRFHAQTAGSTLTARFPDGNIVRASFQTLAAVLGGAQSIHTSAMDEALALPRPEWARLALRTQQLIAWESGVRSADDPVGGSGAIEALTDRLEELALGLMARIEDEGGMLAAIESGFVQREIARSAYRYQQEVEDGRRVVVGVNRFQSEGEEPRIPIHRADPGTEREQAARLAAHRRGRNAEALASVLAGVRETAAGPGNLMPPILAAVRAGATVGEVSATLAGVFGEYRA
jgi:methylmalonyl-CoA mutase N-terminal domain/subunit